MTKGIALNNPPLTSISFNEDPFLRLILLLCELQHISTPKGLVGMFFKINLQKLPSFNALLKIENKFFLELQPYKCVLDYYDNVLEKAHPISPLGLKDYNVETRKKTFFHSRF